MTEKDIPWILNELRVMGWIYVIAVLTCRHTVNVYLKKDEEDEDSDGC